MDIQSVNKKVIRAKNSQSRRFMRNLIQMTSRVCCSPTSWPCSKSQNNKLANSNSTTTANSSSTSSTTNANPNLIPSQHQNNPNNHQWSNMTLRSVDEELMPFIPPHCNITREDFQEKIHQDWHKCNINHHNDILNNKNNSQHIFVKLFANLKDHQIKSLTFLTKSFSNSISGHSQPLFGSDLWNSDNFDILLNIFKTIIYIYMNFYDGDVIIDQINDRSFDDSHTSVGVFSCPDEDMMDDINNFINKLYIDNKKVMKAKIIFNSILLLEQLFLSTRIAFNFDNWKIIVLMVLILSSKILFDSQITLKDFETSLKRIDISFQRSIDTEKHFLTLLNFNIANTNASLMNISEEAAILHNIIF